MEIRLNLVAARTARADFKGGVLNVRMPRHWPASEKEAAIARFKVWAAKREASLCNLPPPVQRPPMSEADLTDLVRRLNADTFQVDLAGVRIGRARFSRLAQANWQTRILTFSKYAVQSLPDRALRYLIIHELAHLRVPNHSPKFWALVSQFEPDWKYWRHVAQTHFVRAAEAPAQPPSHAQPGRVPVAAQRPDPRPDPRSDLEYPRSPAPFGPHSGPRPGAARPGAARPGDARPGDASQGDARPLPKAAGDIAAKALFEDLTGPHGIQLALFTELASEYPI